MREALQKYPRFEAYGPKLIARALFQGHAMTLEYAVQRLVTIPTLGNSKTLS